MFSQLFTNSCRSCFSVLPCLKIRRGHHTFLTDFLPVLSVTLSVKASFAKKWPYKWTAQRSFYQSILHMSRGNNQMLFHWDSVKENHSQKPHTADWILTQQTGYWYPDWILDTDPVPVPAMHTGCSAIRVGNSSVWKTAGKGHQNHLDFGCGSAPETAVFKFAFSRVLTCHLTSSCSGWEEDHLYLYRA